MRRIHEGRPDGVAEQFFTLVRQQVMARDDSETGFSLETACLPLIDGLGEAASELASAIAGLEAPDGETGQGACRRSWMTKPQNSTP